ncbi:MAG: polysaccharide export protein [Alphaproteobacteria bacterium]|nr:MAG: polysaccharide export protein [Alphaproteobacteria bacterium]
MIRFLLPALALILMTGCSRTTALGGDPSLQVVPSTELPAPTASDLTALDRPYLVGPFDKLKIDVFGIEELSGKEVQVDASGRLSFPLVGVLEVSGRTPGEIQEMLRTRLENRYVRDPQVTVNLTDTVSQVVTVEGEVKEPGLYPVIGRMTLLRAIARAKGTTEFSKLDDVVIFRTVQGKNLAALYNIRLIRRGNYADPEIYANDVVVVGDSKARRMFKDFLQIAPLLSTPIILALQK